MEVIFKLTNKQATALRAALAPCFGVEKIFSDEDVFVTNDDPHGESSQRGDFEHFDYFVNDIGGIGETCEGVRFFVPSHSATNPAALLALSGNECRLEGHLCALKADGYVDLIRDLPGDVAIKSYITSDGSLLWHQTNSEWV